MTQITVREPTEDDLDFDQLPSYNDKGRILFYFLPLQNPHDWLDRVEILDYDPDKSPFWLNEGSCMDYVVEGLINLELEGYYVIEGVTGFGWKDYFGEYDERWEFETCRRASEQEIETGLLDELAS